MILANAEKRKNMILQELKEDQTDMYQGVINVVDVSNCRNLRKKRNGLLLNWPREIRIYWR